MIGDHFKPKVLKRPPDYKAMLGQVFLNLNTSILIFTFAGRRGFLFLHRLLYILLFHPTLYPICGLFISTQLWEFALLLCTPLRQASLLPAYKLSTLIPTSETVFSHIPLTLRDTHSMTLFQAWVKAHLLNHLPLHQTVPVFSDTHAMWHWVMMCVPCACVCHVCVCVCVCVCVDRKSTL